MDCWTVYFNPSDYPGKHVVRRFNLGLSTGCPVKPTGDVLVADSLEEARALIPYGLLCFPRAFKDDIVIVECWM